MNRTYTDNVNNPLKVVKVKANAGDVVLFNRFAYHNRSISTAANQARFICNRNAALKELRLDRTDGTDSPFEISLKRALEQGKRETEETKMFVDKIRNLATKAN
jgi:hypothetical protein